MVSSRQETRRWATSWHMMPTMGARTLALVAVAVLVSACQTSDPTARNVAAATASDAGATPCTTNAQCDNNNPCTIDTCDLLTMTCVYTPIAGCCTSVSDCTDGAVCEDVVCRADHMCAYPKIPGCCTMDSQCNNHDICDTNTCDTT